MEISKICLTLIEPTIDGNIGQINKYKREIDMVELRADYLDRYQLAYLHQFPALVDLPVILTIRRKADGGKFDSSEMERRMLFLQALEGRFAFVDLEFDLRDPDLEKKIKARGTRVIRSFHDCKGVPANLQTRLGSLATVPGELPKIAVMPQSTADLVKILTCALESKLREKIVIGMGDYGFATRILASRLGSYLTFCSAGDGGAKAAPGHIDPVMLNDIYRFKSIGPDSLLCGIIGNPVMHTASPRIHNSGYSRLKLDAVYVPFLVDKLADFMDVVRLLDIRGFSVTIPHKESIIPFLSEKSAELDVIGACNTVLKTPRGLSGFNTDVPGFMAPLQKALSGRRLSGLKATVIGAGGAARAVVYGLSRAGVQVLILNRTRQRADVLARAFLCRQAGLDAEGIALMEEYADIIVQTTSAGMEPDIDKDPLPGYAFNGRELVYDLIYTPPVTRFLQRAEKAGCRIIPGKEMLLNQAYEQFAAFTGKEISFLP